MFPYQIYQALADQHIRDLTADAQRHGRRAATQHAAADPIQGPSRLQSALTHLLALVHAPTRTAAAGVATTSTATSPAVSTRTSVPVSSPMGCVA